MENEIYINRLKELVKIASILLDEAVLRKKEIVRFKRTTFLTDQYKKSLEKFLTKPVTNPSGKRPTTSTIEPKIGGIYIYYPDTLTYSNFKKYSGQIAVLLQTQRSRIGAFNYKCDSIYDLYSDYLIYIEEYDITFWTRIGCLKK